MIADSHTRPRVTLARYSGRRERIRRLPATGQGEGLLPLPFSRPACGTLFSPWGEGKNPRPPMIADSHNRPRVTLARYSGRRERIRRLPATGEGSKPNAILATKPYGAEPLPGLRPFASRDPTSCRHTSYQPNFYLTLPCRSAILSSTPPTTGRTNKGGRNMLRRFIRTSGTPSLGASPLASSAPWRSSLASVPKSAPQVPKRVKKGPKGVHQGSGKYPLCIRKVSAFYALLLLANSRKPLHFLILHHPPSSSPPPKHSFSQPPPPHRVIAATRFQPPCAILSSAAVAIIDPAIRGAP
jgi:hypothetical protein